MASSLFVAATIFVTTVAAAAVCGQREEIVTVLAERHGERPIALAITNEGNLVELWGREEGAWTLLVSTPTGGACVHASGDAVWMPLPLGDPA